MSIANFNNISLDEISKKTKDNKELFVTINEIKLNNKKTSLNNIPYTIGDNFSTKDILSTGGSATLNNYIPIFDSTVTTKLAESGAIQVGKTTIDEFEIAKSNINGSALAVARDIVPFAIGSDANGALRKWASDAKIVGYKPTYGMISRFGLFAVASVFDTVGIYAKNVKDAAIVANEVKGIDENDMNTWDCQNIDLINAIDNNINDKKLFYIKELINEEFINQLKMKGINAQEESLNINLVSAIKSIHTCILSAETTTTLANLTGIPFGECGKGIDADEMMVNYRTNLTSEVKNGLIIGAFSLLKDNLDKFYYNSLRIRNIIFQELNNLFERYDAMILPTEEKSLLLANLCGYPSITIPENILITGAQKEDAKILNIANIFSENKGGE